MKAIRYWLIEIAGLIYSTFASNKELKKRYQKSLMPWYKEQLESYRRMRDTPSVSDMRGELFVSLGSNALHRPEYEAIIQDWMFHQASFRSEDAFWRFFRRLGLHMEPRPHLDSGNVRFYALREHFREAIFCNRRQLPKGCHPIMLLSNGSLVKGYWRRDGDAIEVYRPNPNSPLVYKPVPFRLHWGHMLYIGGM